jgi:hypothetical protein
MTEDDTQKEDHEIFDKKHPRVNGNFFPPQIAEAPDGRGRR